MTIGCLWPILLKNSFLRINPERTLVQLRVISSLGKSAQRHSCALTVDMSISGFAAIMPSAV
ncbi:MAG: hypothetical protein OEM64_15570, partial [Gammaproteobacteria bacterium]|nr:hypothetical protein [Gammaproteobacteria bacterium]